MKTINPQGQPLTAEEVYDFAHNAAEDASRYETHLLAMLAQYIAVQQDDVGQFLLSNGDDDNRLVARMTNLSTALRLTKRLALEVAITINPGIDRDEL